MEFKDLKKMLAMWMMSMTLMSMSLLHERFTNQAYNRHFIDDLENT